MSAPSQSPADAAPADDCYDPAEMGPRHRSMLAVASIVMSVLPIASFVAPVLGIAALFTMRRNPKVDGAILAWAGIIVGSVASAVTLGGAYMQYRSFTELVGRPQRALMAAFAGDTEGFRAEMTKPGSQVPSAELERWVTELRAAHGALRGVRIADRAPPNAVPPKSDRQTPAAFVALFERDEVPMTVLFEAEDGRAFGVGTLRIRRFTLDPAAGTRIVFPDDDPVAPTEQPPEHGIAAPRPGA